MLSILVTFAQPSSSCAASWKRRLLPFFEAGTRNCYLLCLHMPATSYFSMLPSAGLRRGRQANWTREEGGETCAPRLPHALLLSRHPRHLPALYSPSCLPARKPPPRSSGNTLGSPGTMLPCVVAARAVHSRCCCKLFLLRGVGGLLCTRFCNTVGVQELARRAGCHLRCETPPAARTLQQPAQHALFSYLCLELLAFSDALCVVPSPVAAPRLPPHLAARTTFTTASPPPARPAVAYRLPLYHAACNTTPRRTLFTLSLSSSPGAGGRRLCLSLRAAALNG